MYSSCNLRKYLTSPAEACVQGVSFYFFFGTGSEIILSVSLSLICVFFCAQVPFLVSPKAMSTKSIVRNSDPNILKPETGVMSKYKKRKLPPAADGESSKGQKFSKREGHGKRQHEDTTRTKEKEGTVPVAKRRAERKAERRDILTKAREKWEQLRPKATGKEKSVKLCDELYADLRGRIREFAFRPDGSRIIQWLLTSSSPSTRSAVLTELLEGPSDAESKDGEKGGPLSTPFFIRLFTDRYAKHLAIKLLRIIQAPKRVEILETQVIPQVSSLVRTLPGATALDIVYSTLLNGPSRSRLALAILFSKQAVHWQQVQQKLEKTPSKRSTNGAGGSIFNRAMEHVPKEFRNAVLDSAYETASQLVEKEELLSLELVHAVLREWLEVSMMGDQVDNVRALSSALATHIGRLCHTRAGMSVSLNVIKILDAKHRKKAVRSVTGVVRKMVMDDFGHRVMLGLMEWTDDTRMVGQLLVGELFKSESKDAATNNGKDGVVGEQSEVWADGGAERKRGGRSKAEKKGKEVKNGTKVSDEAKEGAYDTEFMAQLCEHKNGRMILLNLLFGQDSRYFNPEVYGIVWERIDEEKFGKTSKKNGEVRRQELVSYAEEGIKAVILKHGCALLENLRASPVMVGAAVHEGTRGAVIQAVKDIFEQGKIEEICKSVNSRRALGAVFKVSNDVAAGIVASLGADVVRTLTSIDNTISIAKHLAYGSGNAESIALFEQADGNAAGQKAFDK